MNDQPTIPRPAPFGESGLVSRHKMTFTWPRRSRRTPIARRVALRYAREALRGREWRIAFDWLRTAWRGWYTGHITGWTQ